MTQVWPEYTVPPMQMDGFRDGEATEVRPLRQRVRPGTWAEAIYRDTSLPEKASCQGNGSLKLLDVPFASKRREPANTEDSRVLHRERKGEAQCSVNTGETLDPGKSEAPDISDT